MDAAAQVHAAFVNLRRADVGAGAGAEVVLSAWCPTMDLCAAVTSDGQLAVHRMNWQQLWALAPSSADAAPVTALAWRPDGKLLATGHADGALAVWDVETGEPVVRHARAHFAPVTALDWSLTPLSARIDHDDDAWCAGGDEGGSSGTGAAAPPPPRFSAAACAATAAAYEDRQARLFPADGLVLMSGGAAGAGAMTTTTNNNNGSSNIREDPYAELFRGAPALALRGGGGGGHQQQQQQQQDAAAPSAPPLDLLCAADRRGCLSAWVGAGRVQVGDVAGVAPRPGGAGANDDDDDDDDLLNAAAAAPPPPAPTLVALSTALDQSACVSVAWHPPPPPPPPPEEEEAGNDNKTKTSDGGGGGVVAAPLALRPLRAARREVRHWARLHWRLKGLLESAGGALRAASREWASASSALRKRVLGELAEALAAHSSFLDAGGDAGGDPDQQAATSADPRADLLLLLATGSAGPGVHAWLTASLGEAGVQRVARAVDAALERAHALLLHSCLPALERAAFLLGELRGLAAACGPTGGHRGALLGLRAEALEPLEAAAVRAVVRAEQVRVAVGDLTAGYRAMFTWLLRTARQLESASAAAADRGGDNAAAAAAALLANNKPPPEPPTGPDAALADVLLPFLDDDGPLATDPLSPELGQRDAPLDAAQRPAAARWLHGGVGGADDGGSSSLSPEAVVSRVLRILYPPERGAAAMGAGEEEEEEARGRNSTPPPPPPPPLSLAGQVAALAEACDEALTAPQSSVSARLTVGQAVRLAPALCFSAAPSGAGAGPQQQQHPPPRVAVAPAGEGEQREHATNNDGDGGGDDSSSSSSSSDDGVVLISLVVPAAGLAALAPSDEGSHDAAASAAAAAAAAADGILVVRARAVPPAAPTPAAAGRSSRSRRRPPGSLELSLSAVLVRGDPGVRVVDAAPYKDGQLAVLSSSAPAAGGAAEVAAPAAAAAAAAAARRAGQGDGGGRAAAGEAQPPVLALLDLSSAPFAPIDTTTTTTTALEACLARGAVVDAGDLAAAGCVRAARLAGFAAAVAPLAVSRARGLALVLSDMQRLAVLDVDADEEGVADGGEEEEEQDDEA